MRLSLGMIFKDEVNQFKRILDSYHWMFDEVVVAVDENREAFQEIAKAYEKLNIKILPYTWINDFADKRNFVHKNITGDYYAHLS